LSSSSIKISTSLSKEASSLANEPNKAIFEWAKDETFFAVEACVLLKN